MKYIVILGDGMADYPVEKLNGKTPLMVANKPCIDDLASKGVVGKVLTVPGSLKPGSDVANLSVMGYNPLECYTGRSPLEGLSIGIDMLDTDVAFRANLVSLSDAPNFEDKIMVDYSSSEISTSDADVLIKYLKKELENDFLTLYTGTSYRHCLIYKNGSTKVNLTPPHDISDKVIKEYLPSGDNSSLLLDLMKKSYDLLNKHPLNIERKKQGKNPANCIWLWGAGTKPQLENFNEKFGVRSGVISAVDLIKGIAIGSKMDVVEVDNITGTYKTNFDGKAQAAINYLKNTGDFIYIHMEAPDECGHQGDVDNKILSIELISEKVVKKIKEELDKENIPFRMLILPDHATPICLKTHVSDMIPYILYDSTKEVNSGYSSYTEKIEGNEIKEGYTLINKLFEK